MYEEPQKRSKSGMKCTFCNATASKASGNKLILTFFLNSDFNGLNSNFVLD